MLADTLSQDRHGQNYYTDINGSFFKPVCSPDHVQKTRGPQGGNLECPNRQPSRAQRPTGTQAARLGIPPTASSWVALPCGSTATPCT